MNEIQSIAAAYADARLRNEPCALATIVNVQGSSYRKAGARMLIIGDAGIVGSVSGGCLESDVIERAQGVMRTGEPVLMTYDTTGDDEIIFGLGMGCRGVIDVIIEPLAGRTASVLSVMAESMEMGKTVAVATVYRTHSSCLLSAGDHVMSQGGSVSFDVPIDVSAVPIAYALDRAIEANKTSSERIDLGEGSADVFLEVLQPPMPLVIFGAGNDAQPLARMAKSVGWRVSVVDGRSAYATDARFPDVDQLIVSNFDDLAESVELDARSATVVMTHNYLHDAALIEALLAGPAEYIGILGSRSRINEMLQDLEDRKIYDPMIHAERVHGPIGLDIGADTPDLIALSIVAEIQAAVAGRPGGTLRDSLRQAHIAPIQKAGDVERMQFKCALSAA